jgi:hypothetical protein
VLNFPLDQKTADKLDLKPAFAWILDWIELPVLVERLPLVVITLQIYYGYTTCIYIRQVFFEEFGGGNIN